MSIFSKWFSNKESESSTSVEPKKPQYSASDYCDQGQKSLDAGKYVEAMEYFQAAIETDKRFEKAYFLLATAYEKQGKLDKAKAALYRLLAENPNNNEAIRRIEGLSGQSQNSQIDKSTPSQTLPQSISAPRGKASKSYQSTGDNKFSGRNIGCALFGVLFCIPCGIILFSEDKFWGGFWFVLIALLCIIGPFANPDFWK